MQELGQAGRSLLLEQLHYYNGRLNAFPPFDHPPRPPRAHTLKIIEWLSPKLLQSVVWLILHLALVLLSRNSSRTWFSSPLPIHLGNYGLQISHPDVL